MSAQMRWRKASSSQSSSNCVELAHTMEAVRDSKNPAGPVLVADLSALVTAVRSGRLG
jgi:hypothetical protein